MHSLLKGRVVVTGHQPLLFGHAGYWSKVAVAGHHLVTAGVGRSRADNLTAFRHPNDAMTYAPVRATGRRVSDLELVDRPWKLVNALRCLDHRRHPYRRRLAPVLDALTQARPGAYLDLWQAVFFATLLAADLPCPMLTLDVATDEGVNAQARWQTRLARLAPVCDLYLCGPGARAYLTTPTARPVLVHSMREANPLPFLHTIATEPDPAARLAAYDLETLDGAVIRSIDQG